MPAVSWPSEASFSVWTRRSCAVRKSSSDFASSRVRASTLSNSRTFSIAIAAWSAKVVTSSICLSVNGRTSRRVNARTPIGLPSRNIGTPRMVRKPPKLLRLDKSIFWVCLNIGNMHHLAVKQGPSGCGPTLRHDGYSPDVLREFVGEAVSCGSYETPRLVAGNCTLIGLAQSGGRLD